ncbi:molybdopterin molybdotransferase MoeA [candidate division WOR-3 bacterium]|nr:molybdopterin molybdotransferase MoeA [candidate division WOR-3 bacterium]
MLHPDKAVEFLLGKKMVLKSEPVLIENALGRPLNYDVYSKMDLPPYKKAAMDGFAYDFVDLSDEFRITEFIPAGKTPEKKVSSGECAKIMTGGIVPEGADTIIRKEYAEEKDGKMKIIRAEEAQNIVKQGEYVKKDQIVLQKCIVGPKEISVLVSSGYREIMMPVSPLIGVITTGNELEEPGRPLSYGKIYDSNLFEISSLLDSCFFRKKLYMRVSDDLYEMTGIIGKALDECDIVLITGGSSVGDLDLTGRAFIKNGLEIRFDSLAIKPGKPTMFGEREGKFAFGMPGNPVSVFVIFEMIVKPFVYNLMKFSYKPNTQKGIYEEGRIRETAERVEYLPVKIDQGIVKNVNYHGSGDIVALTRSNALLKFDIGQKVFKPGSQVDVRQI